MFVTKCGKCGKKTLEVVSGRFSATGMTLTATGFSPSDAKNFDTEDEVVRCTSCKTTQPLRVRDDDEAWRGRIECGHCDALCPANEAVSSPSGSICPKCAVLAQFDGGDGMDRTDDEPNHEYHPGMDGPR